MPDDMSVNIEVTVSCDACGDDLTYTTGPTYDRGRTINTIKVTPCDTCLQKAADDARE